jgi:superfamily II DNA or RNA helicase
MTLLEPQVDHAKRLLDSLYLNGVAADLSETGCGKTYVATWIAKQMNVPVTVICPKGVIPVWQRILNSVGIKVNSALNGKAVAFDGYCNNHIVNYEQLIRGTKCNHLLEFNTNTFMRSSVWDANCGIKIKIPKNSLVIMDELHRCKGGSSLTSVIPIRFKREGYKVLMMSATAATMPTEMKAFGYVTNLHSGYTFKSWLDSVGDIVQTRFGEQLDLASTRSQEGMRSIHDHLFNVQQLASRLTRLQMKALFPDNRVFAECVDMGSNTTKIKQVYELMESEIARLDKDASEYSSHVFAQMVRARRMAEVLKVPTMIEMVNEWYRENISPVVFVNFTETIEALKTRLELLYGDEVGVIMGGQSTKKRQSIIDAFQEDRKRIMLVNMAAGNEGIGLHDLNGKYSRGAILNPSFSAIHLSQALGRIHRAEGKTPCIQKIMFAAGTIEERCCERVQAKINNLDMLNDGDLTGDIRIW